MLCTYIKIFLGYFISWCDRYGDIMLDVVEKEFKKYVGEMGNSQAVDKEKDNLERWTTFGDDTENSWDQQIMRWNPQGKCP